MEIIRLNYKELQNVKDNYVNPVWMGSLLSTFVCGEALELFPNLKNGFLVVAAVTGVLTVVRAGISLRIMQIEKEVGLW